MMIPRLVLSASTFLLLTGTATATVITTPVLTGIADGGFSCHVVNASASRQRVKVEIVPKSSEAETVEILPGLIYGVSTSSTQGENAYCRVTTRGRGSALRVSFESRTSGFPRGQTIAVVQGQ